MLYFVAIGILTALIRKRNPLTLLDQISFRYPFLLIGAFGIQIGLAILFFQYSIEYVYILEASLLLLMVGLWLNRHLKGVSWILVGTACNLIAILMHKGRMPVTEWSLRISGLPTMADDYRHQLAMPGDFWLIADWIPIFRKVLSPGDVLVGIGLIILISVYSKQGTRNHEGS